MLPCKGVLIRGIDMYFSLDGADGTGKTSIIEILKTELPKKLKKEGIPKDIIFTRQPGDTTSPTCVMLRDLCLNDKYGTDDLTSELIFVADISENLAKTVIPNRLATVVTDRGILTHYAYAYAKGMLTEFLGKAYYEASRKVLPYYTFVITANSRETRLSEVEPEFSDGQDRMEKEGDTFQRKVEDYYNYAVAAAKVNKFMFFGTDINYNKIVAVNNSGDIMEAVNEISNRIASLEQEAVGRFGRWCSKKKKRII